MIPSKVFISYSRNQFYFAESLTTELESLHGFDAWFDSHDLSPGMDWAAGIEHGLALCDAMVILVSPQTLASKYCRQEWETMRANGKPLFLAIFEYAPLPPDLVGLPIVDLRANFKRGVTRLAAVMRGEQAAPITMNKFPKRRRPPIHWLILLLYVLTVAISFDRMLSRFDPLTIFFPFVLLSVIGAAWQNLTRRTYTYRRMTIVVPLFSLALNGVAVLYALGSITAAIALFLQGVLPENSIISSVLIVATIGAVYAIGIALPFVVYRLLFDRVPDLLRWAPTGQASEALRNRINRRARAAQSLTFTDLGKRFRLYYAPPDAAIAAQARQAMTEACYVETTDEESPADHHIAIFSNCTTEAFAARIDRIPGKVVTIFASTVKLPASLTTLSKYQWVDYRTRKPENLRNMVEDLYIADSGIQTANSVLNPIPESYEVTMLPPLLSAVVAILLFVPLSFVQALLTSFAFDITKIATVIVAVLLWYGVSRRALTFIQSVVLLLVLIAALLSSMDVYAIAVGVILLVSTPWSIPALHRWLPIPTRSAPETPSFPLLRTRAAILGAGVLSVAGIFVPLAFTLSGAAPPAYAQAGSSFALLEEVVVSVRSFATSIPNSTRIQMEGVIFSSPYAWQGFRFSEGALVPESAAAAADDGLTEAVTAYVDHFQSLGIIEWVWTHVPNDWTNRLFIVMVRYQPEDPEMPPEAGVYLRRTANWSYGTRRPVDINIDMRQINHPPLTRKIGYWTYMAETQTWMSELYVSIDTPTAAYLLFYEGDRTHEYVFDLDGGFLLNFTPQS